MAVKDEDLRVNITINGKQGEAALRKLEKENRAYLKSNEDLIEQKKKLDKANQQESVEYKKLTNNIEANNRSIEANTQEMDKHRKTVKLTELTIAQLRKEQKRLISIRDNLKPETEEYKQLNTQIDAVVKRKGELINVSKETGDVVEDMNGKFASLGEVWTGLSTGHIPTLQKGLRGIAGGIGQVTKAGLAFIATPIGATIAVLAGIGFVVKQWFDYNDEIKESIILTEQITRLQGEQADAIRLRNEALKETFGTDEKETLEVARNLVEQFGISYGEAFDVIEDGYVKGQKANNEYLDSLREYPVFFKSMGFSAQQFKDIISTGYDLGIYSDKLPDALKEFDISIREQTKSTREALINAFGKTFTDDLLQRVNTGKTSTKDALQEIATEAKNTGLSIEQNQRLTADVFRGAGEDIGGAVKIFEALDVAAQNANRAYTPLEQSTRDLADANLELEQAQDAALKSDNYISLTRDLQIFWTKTKTLFYNGVQFITDTFTSNVDFVIATFTSLVVTAKQLPDILIEGVKNVASNVLNTIKTFGGLGDVVTKLIHLDFSGAKASAIDFKNNFSQAFNGVKQSATDTVAQIIATQQAAKNLALEDLFKKRIGNVASVNAEKDAEEEKKRKEAEAKLTAEEQAKAEADRQKAIDEAIRKKQSVQEAIDKFDEEQAIRDQLKQIDKDQRDEEEAVIRKEIEFEKLNEEALGDTELLAQLETAKLNEIQAIRDEFAEERAVKEKQEQDKLQKQREADQKKQIQDRIKFNNQILNGAIDLFGRQSKIGQAFLAFKGVMAAKEMLIELGVLKAKAAVALAEGTTATAVGAANTAKVGFPQNVPLLIAFAAQAVGIISAIKGAVGATKKIKAEGFEDGLYPILRTDGKTFNSRIKNKANTQLVTEPTYFRDANILTGEGGPEIIIDTPTLKNLAPEVVQNIYATAARTRGYQNGFYGSNNPDNTNTNTITPSTEEATQSNNVMLLLTSAINNLVENGVIAKTYIGLQQAEEIKNLQKKLDDTINASKN